MGKPFEVVRSVTVNADAATVHGLLEDFHAWQMWSPWEGLDPAMQRTFTGPDSGVGAHYAWKGNRKAGEGHMTITGSSPEAVDLDLVFMKPMDTANKVSFLLAPAGAGTEVTWRMTGELSGLMGLFSRLFSMDKLVGKDFDKGLAQLKSVAESARQSGSAS